MSHAQSVWLNDTLFVGGGHSDSESLRDEARLYLFKPGFDTEWSSIDTPTRRFGLVLHNCQLLLVGGRKYNSGELTSQIFTLRSWNFVETPDLPPITERRSSSAVVSDGSALIVAGGRGRFGVLSSVEFREFSLWKTAPSLPREGSDNMRSALNGDQWYLINGKTAYSASLSSLISGSRTKASPWKKLADVPHVNSAVAFFDGHILSIGGNVPMTQDMPTTAINAFSTDSRSWKHVADLPIPLEYSNAIVLPSGELVVIGGKTKHATCSKRVYGASIKG